MGFYKSKSFNEYNLNKPKFYLRYVDEIPAAFGNEQDSLNLGHPNIKFTIEKQINHSMAFLDVFISGVNNQNVTLQTYHRTSLKFSELYIIFIQAYFNETSDR